MSSHGDIRTKESKAIPMSTAKGEDKYPDIYRHAAENYKISDKFCGYMDSMSTDNNLMILVELIGLSYRYGTTISANHKYSAKHVWQVQTMYVLKECFKELFIIFIKSNT